MKKKCRCELMACLGSGKCVCCFAFLILLIAYFFCNQGCDFMEFCSEVLCWEMVTAISTLIAAYLAYKAYNNSVRMRRQASFDSVFSQLLVNYRSYQLDKRLLTTKVKKEDDSLKYVPDSTFHYFCTIYEKESERNMQTLEGITRIWSNYSNSLVYRANFLNTFKYIYYVVDLVANSPLDEKMKRRYVKIVQSQLNMDILFCYLINLICMSRGEVNDYIYTLRKYDFFKDIFKDGERYKPIIESTIPSNIRNCYYKENRRRR